jgi:hypothetical protein
MLGKEPTESDSLSYQAEYVAKSRKKRYGQLLLQSTKVARINFTCCQKRKICGNNPYIHLISKSTFNKIMEY